MLNSDLYLKAKAMMLIQKPRTQKNQRLEYIGSNYDHDLWFSGLTSVAGPGFYSWEHLLEGTWNYCCCLGHSPCIADCQGLLFNFHHKSVNFGVLWFCHLQVNWWDANVLDTELHNNLFSAVLDLKPLAGTFYDIDKGNRLISSFHYSLGGYFGYEITTSLLRIGAKHDRWDVDLILKL